MLILILNSAHGQGLIINNGTAVTAFGGNLIVSGNLTNNGNMTDLGGTVTFCGSDQSIGGSSISAFNNITITGSSTTTVQSMQRAAGIIKVNGTLNSNGFLTLISTAEKTALVDGAGTGQISGNVNMERYLASGYGYKYISSPFQAASVNELSDDMDVLATFPPVYRYDENRTSAGWVNHSMITNVLAPLSGYAVNFGGEHAEVTFDLYGVVNNGNMSVSLYNNNRTYTEGFNLVGNPYPSPIDWHAPSGWTRTNIDDALYFFKGSDTDQYGGYYTTFIDGLSSDGIATNIIPSMQGFFVHVTDGSYPVTGSVEMNNNVRVNDQYQSYIKGEGEKPLIRFTAGFSDILTSLDYAVIYFDDKATLEFDGQLDALKLMNTDVNTPDFYFITPAERYLQIYALPALTGLLYKIPLGIKLGRDGQVVVKIQDIDPDFSHYGISITDMVKGTEHNLLPDKEFKIWLKSGEYKNRFILNLTDIATVFPDLDHEPESFSIYYSNGILHSEIKDGEEGGTLSIFNLLGQTLYIKQLYDDGYHEHNIRLDDGIYIATYISGKSRSNRKIPVKN